MSTLKALLNDVTVEWKALGDIADLYNGLTGKNKADFDDGNAKFVTYKNIFGNIELNPNTLESVKVSANEKQNEVKYGDVLFTGSSENTSDVGVSSSVTTKTDYKVYLNSFSFGLRFKSDFKLIPEFTKYLFRSNIIRDQIIKTASGVTRYNISKKRFVKVKIPIPFPNDPQKSLAIQQEIVRVLDNLSEQNKALTSALAQEIDQRKKQYEYYREELFRFEGKEVEWKAMGEVLKIKNGKDYKQFKSGEIPVYGSGGIMTHIDTHVFDKASVLIPRKGSLKNLFFVTEPFWTVDTIFWTDINRKLIEPKFIFYYLKTQNLEELNMAGGVPSLTQSVLNKLPLPIPHPNDPQKSLAIQQEIVRVLDKFDEATKSIVTELEKEIELRNKQYEYYRNELLMFNG